MPKNDKVPRLIEAEVTFRGQWWVAEFSIDGREYGTQARHLEELEEMVQDAASLMTGEPMDHFTVQYRLASSVEQELIENYRRASRRAREAQENLSAAAREAVRTLRSSGIPSRDIASMMGVSVQRVSQLAHA